MSAYIPVEWADFKDKRKLPWVHIIGLGIKAVDDNPQLIARISELEQSNTKLTNKLQVFAQKCFVLEEKMADMASKPKEGQNVASG